MSDMNRPEDAPEDLDTSEDRLAEDIGDVIDDDDSVRTALCRLLKRSGAIVQDLNPRDFDDEEVLAKIEGSDANVILLDVHLGDRGGISVWRSLAARSSDLASRVVFITGLVAGDPTWDEADETGQPVLGKPFDLPELIQTLTRLGTGG